MEAYMRRTSVGIREAKVHLSRYLKLVQKGEEVVITDHGRPVGEILPIGCRDLPLTERIDLLVERGILEPHSGERMARIPPPIPFPRGAAQAILQEDRDA
jgi:prevent-host-death family protein